MMRKLIYTIATGAITAGLLAPAAQASTPELALASAGTSVGVNIKAPAAADRWFTLWSGQTKGKTLIGPGRNNKARVLQAVIQCWSGGDGTRATVRFDRRRLGVYYRASKPRTFPCDGTKKYYRVSSARIGTVYRVNLWLSPKSHTVMAWMQNYG
ncbi:hypothetical protein [Nonomuraea sp. NPDC049141]|uniref:hypothetical protein n=1 Tax=Nonomuraea sp. NPDC049141 TaxID=3155500 RepID=UPI0033F53C9E